jgi:hypothetical protein
MKRIIKQSRLQFGPDDAFRSGPTRIQRRPDNRNRDEYHRIVGLARVDLTSFENRSTRP